MTVTGGYGYGRLRELPGYLDSTDSRDSRDSLGRLRLREVTGGYGYGRLRLRLREVTVIPEILEIPRCFFQCIWV